MQMQARLLVMAAFAQLLLGVAYFDSLWLVKKKEAEHQMLQELREGFADAKLKSPFHYLSTMDKVLGCAIAGAPILLLVSSRFSTVSFAAFVCLLFAHSRVGSVGARDQAGQQDAGRRADVQSVCATRDARHAAVEHRAPRRG